MTQPIKNLEDTQPVRPVRSAPEQGFVAPPEDEFGDDLPARGPGCLALGLMLTALGLFGVIIVGLAATAGWTSGQRSAQSNAMATFDAQIQAQLNQIEGDLERGNLELVEIRLHYLETNAPNLPQLAGYQQRATQSALALAPTVTPTATSSPTLEPTQPTAEAPEPTATPTMADPYDLAGRLQRAQSSIGLGQWSSAIDDLDVILGLDPNFEVVTVRNLMSRALNEYALSLYRTGSLAEAIFVTDRAEEFGPLMDGLNFERYVASLYITARSRVGTSDFAGAITALREIANLAPNYMNGEINQLLFRAYSGYGDAMYVSSPCSAVDQYSAALRLFSDATISGKRATAQNWCEFGTPTPEGFVPTPSGDPFAPTPAPIGQP